MITSRFSRYAFGLSMAFVVSGSTAAETGVINTEILIQGESRMTSVMLCGMM